MGGMASTARGPSVVRRPHRRPPRRTRWGRRIAGMLATAGLLGIAVLMATWIAPGSHSDSASLSNLPASTPAPAKAKAKAKKPAKPKLTAKQRAQRTAAVTTLRNQGYLPLRVKDYDPTHELRVLVGYLNGNSLGPRRAFFFVGGRFIGNDSVSGSSQVKLVKSGNTWATLRYGIYAPGGTSPISTQRIRFDWTGASLQPAGVIPASRLRSG
jgi:LppP/LprE lipoprotein